MAVTYDTARIRIAPARNARGLFATTSFRPGEPIIRVEGRIVHYEVLWRRQGSKFAANCIRFGPDTYLDPGDALCRFVNHSCAPNAGVQKIRQRLFLFAAKGIRAGAEILIDYSTTIGDDDIWTMRCKCGSPRCRRVIRNFGSLPLPVKRRYIRKGLVPGYIVRTLT